MNKFLKSSNQLDNYEAEIVEDIPEQFDLSRYKKPKMQTLQQTYGSNIPSNSISNRSTPPLVTSQNQMYGQQVQQNYIQQQQNNQNYYNLANVQQQQQQQQYVSAGQQGMFENVFVLNQNNRDYAGIKQQEIILSPNVQNSQQAYPAATAVVTNFQVANNVKQNYRMQPQPQNGSQVIQLVTPPAQGSSNQAQITTLQRHPPPPPISSVAQVSTYIQPPSIENLSLKQQQANNSSQVHNPHHVQMPYYPAKNDYNGHLITSPSQYPNSTLLKKKNQSGKYINDVKGNDLDIGHHQHHHDEQKYARNHLVDSSGTNWSNKANSSKVETRKKNSFDDDDDDENHPHQPKREYYLKGGENETRESRIISRDNYGVDDRIDHSPHRPQNVNIDIMTQQPQKSSLKQSSKKPGVTFDEKLEVYEVKNPHYGLEVKSEKREIRKKKKDKQKEEEIILKTKFDMKLKIQNQNMLHYHFYEKTLVYNALVYYEENFYRTSIIKLQDKLRNNKPDEKLRDQLLQTIEKDNQITIDIMRYVKKEFLSRLEPYCNQFQTTVDKLHTFPGMFHVMQTAVNSVNYTEIIKFYVNKESNSPSTLRKILGQDGSKNDKFLNNQQASSSIKSPMQRKADLWLPKQVLAAIDLHVKDVCFSSYKTITEFIFKLYEICENDLHMVRAIYKYVLITQLEAFRRNETGALIMRNFDLGIESTNTIFARLCSFTGIENRFLRGLWKTICQEPGEKVEAKCIWNVINLESGWRFIQPAFSPVKYYSRPDISYEETEFYFLTDADSLSHEFFPSDKIWQFNESVVSVKDFEKRPIITPYFRMLNLSILHLSNQTGNLEKEPFKLIIRYPPEYSDSINFKYTLKPMNSYATNNYKNNNLLLSNENNGLEQQHNSNLFVISSLILDENAILFKISALPELGNYNFTVYASLIDESLNATNPNMPAISCSYNDKTSSLSCTPASYDDSKAIFSYKVTCSKLSHFEIPPNRITDINIYGTNNTMKRLGLNCLDFKQGVLGTDREGRINLVFEMSQPLDIEAYLYSSDPSISSKYLELCMLKRVVHNFLILIINPPHAGLYGLDLHGAIKGTFNSLLHSQLPPIGKFLIKSHHQIRSFYQFPKGDNRDWGPKQRFYDLGLHTVGNMDPYIVNEDGKQIEIEIAMLKSVTMWYKFDYDQNGVPKPIDNFCFMNYKNSNKKDKTVSFLLRFPYRGFYHLAVMATDDVFPSRPDEIVYNYLIRVQDPSNEVQSFPIILNPILWKDCCLITPKDFRLNSTDVHFSIIVPRTSQVQVSSNDRVIEQLEPREIENSWVGLVSLNESKFFFIEAEYENKFKKLVRFKGFHSIKD